MKNAAFLLFAPLLLAGCVTTEPHQNNGLAYARLGQTVNVGGPTVTPLRLLEDSRCPQDVQCVWAGRVRIVARITTGPGSAEQELTLGETVPVAGGTLLLADVQPTPKAKAAIPPGDYRFGFRFDGGY